MSTRINNFVALVCLIMVRSFSIGLAQQSNFVELTGARVFESEYAVVDFDLLDGDYIFSSRRDTVFHVYDNNKRYKGSFGRIGRGPGEIPFPSYFPDQGNLYNEKEFLIVNNQLLQISVVNLEQSLEQKKIVKNTSFSVPRKLRGIQSTEVYVSGIDTVVGFYDDLLFKQINGKRGLFVYSVKDSRIETIDVLNNKLSGTDFMASVNINARVSQINPSRTHIVSAQLYNPVFEIVTLKNKSVQVCQAADNIVDTFEESDYRDDVLVEYFDSIDISDESIFVLYRGEQYSDEPRDVNILEYDYECNLRNTFSIDRKYDISKFIFNPLENSFLGYSYATERFYEFLISSN